jgi:formate hydrogenlyase subunit 3/multisubunit Na+/H+ antiporter MnhD subunit
MAAELLALSVALPLAGALVTVVWRRRSESVGILTVLASGILALLLLVRVALHGTLEHAMGAWSPGLGIALRADVLSALLVALSGLVMLASGIYATRYFKEAENKRLFWPLWLLLLTALNALFLSGDLFNIYVTLELLGLSAVALAAFGGQRAAVTAALRYLLLGLMGSMIYLTGLGFLYLGNGSLDLPAVAAEIRPEPTAWLALILMTGGLLLKSALFPLHFWLPPAHANAPAPVSAVLSALVVKAAFYLILRLWLDLFPGVLTPRAGELLGFLGAAAVLWGSWQALRAERLKLLAAYSTVAQLGYLFIGLALLLEATDGPARDALLGGLVLLALTHGFAKAGLFLAAGVVQQHTGHDRIADLQGTAQRLPATTFAMALAGVALIGLPPSGAFLGKWQLLTGSFVQGQWLWILVMAIGSLLAAAYVFRMLGQAFGNRDDITAPDIAAREEWPALLLGVTATLVLGLASGWLWPLLAEHR